MSRFLLFSSLLLFSVFAFGTTESGMDFQVGEATTSLSAVSIALTAVGGLLLGLAAVSVGFRWISGMFKF